MLPFCIFSSTAPIWPILYTQLSLLKYLVATRITPLKHTSFPCFSSHLEQNSASSLGLTTPFVIWPIYFFYLISHHFLVTHLVLMILSWTHHFPTIGPLYFLFFCIWIAQVFRWLTASLHLELFPDVILQREACSYVPPKVHNSFPYPSNFLPGVLLITTRHCYTFISPSPILNWKLIHGRIMILFTTGASTQ